MPTHVWKYCNQVDDNGFISEGDIIPLDGKYRKVYLCHGLYKLAAENLVSVRMNNDYSPILVECDPTGILVFEYADGRLSQGFATPEHAEFWQNFCEITGYDDPDKDVLVVSWFDD